LGHNHDRLLGDIDRFIAVHDVPVVHAASRAYDRELHHLLQHQRVAT
jgi:hypothetical protein